MPDLEIVKTIRNLIKTGNLDALRSLLRADRSYMAINTPFGTLLHEAVKAGNLIIVEYLVEEGIDINECGNSITGGAALEMAAGRGNLAIVKYLLDHNAKMDVSESVKNPMFAAIHGGHLEVARLLIEYGIDTRVKYSGENMRNMDALAFAEEWGRTDIMKLIEESWAKQR